MGLLSKSIDAQKERAFQKPITIQFIESRIMPYRRFPSRYFSFPFLFSFSFKVSSSILKKYPIEIIMTASESTDDINGSGFFKNKFAIFVKRY